MKVFISSTYADLIEYRECAIEVVNRYQCTPLAMELFMAKPQEPTKACEKEIRECDIFVGIYAHRYGFVPKGSGKSITHLEYEQAKKLNKDCLCFAVNEDFPWVPEWIDKKNKAKLQDFLALIKTNTAVVFFESPKDLESKLAASLGKLLLEKQTAQSGAAAGIASPYLAHPYPLSDHFSGRVERQFKGKKYSLIMGIENYPEISGQTKVNYAGNDANAMADYARKAGFHLIDGKPLLDGEATYKKVIKKLVYLFSIAETDDFILLYFAGHGFYSEDGGYLIPFDYQKENAIDESSCISFESINKRFKNKKTRHFIFFLDTCHSGYAGKQMDIREAKTESRDIHITHEAGEKVKSEMEAMLHKGEKSQGVGRLVFTSSAPNEKSHHSDDFQHGLFTHYLLSGLESAANEKQVNVEDLVRSVKHNVTAFCLDKNWVQTPTAYSNIQGAFFLPAYETQPGQGQLISAPDFSQDIQKARKALQSGDFDAAAQIINTILQKDRLNFEANLLLEELDSRRNLQILKEKTEIRRNYEEWLRRGEEFRKAGDFFKARECFENAAGIFPDSQMAQSYIKEIDTRQQIIKLDDIEVPAGDKAVILKNLFQVANDAFKTGEFTTALNHYNKILKTYPGNQRAIKEKKQLFDKWLQQYKDSARYLEMLGLFENIILPDENLCDDQARLEEEYNETVLLYTQVFLKSHIGIEIEQSIKEMQKKGERKASYEKLLAEYHELAMDAEYDELLKITDKLKSELDHTNDRIKLESEIIGIKDIFKAKEEALSDHIVSVLESVIKEGVRDRYILYAYEHIVSEKVRLKFDEIKKMPEKDRNQILTKRDAFLKFQEGYPAKLTDEINMELTRLNTIPEIVGIFEMPTETLNELSKKLELLKKIDRSKYDLVKFDIASEIKKIENNLKYRKDAIWDKRYEVFFFSSILLYTILYSIIWFKILIYYKKKGGFFNILGLIVVGIVTWGILYFMGYLMDDFYPYKIREKKVKIIFIELGKFGLMFSITIISYINMLSNHETFFNWNLLFAIPLIFVSFILCMLGIE